MHSIIPSGKTHSMVIPLSEHAETILRSVIFSTCGEQLGRPSTKVNENNSSVRGINEQSEIQRSVERFKRNLLGRKRHIRIQRRQNIPSSESPSVPVRHRIVEINDRSFIGSAYGIRQNPLDVPVHEREFQRGELPRRGGDGERDVVHERSRLAGPGKRDEEEEVRMETDLRREIVFGEDLPLGLGA